MSLRYRLTPALSARAHLRHGVRHRAVDQVAPAQTDSCEALLPARCPGAALVVTPATHFRHSVRHLAVVRSSSALGDGGGHTPRGCSVVTEWLVPRGLVRAPLRA